MTMNYAEDTSVSVEKTRAQLETLITQNGADAFGYMTGDGKAIIQFRFNGKFVRFLLPLPSSSDKRFTEYKRRGAYYPTQRTQEAAHKEWEQACRSVWRALFLAVKAKLVAVAVGITTFEQEFLAHIVLPDGRTAGEMMIPQIEDAYQSGRMPAFQLALPVRAEA
jgi:hypothetical protein